MRTAGPVSAGVQSHPILLPDLGRHVSAAARGGQCCRARASGSVKVTSIEGRGSRIARCFASHGVASALWHGGHGRCVQECERYARSPHAVHWERCPPSAAVRHGSMACMAARWLGSSGSGYGVRDAELCRRQISANATLADLPRRSEVGQASREGGACQGVGGDGQRRRPASPTPQ